MSKPIPPDPKPPLGDGEHRVSLPKSGKGMERTGQMLLVSKRLLLFTLATLVAAVAVFGVGIWSQRFPLSWFCFECGIIGGFVSIQQRLKQVGDEELSYLAQSWTAILVVPIFGGVFALVLYLLFLSGIIEGTLFPKMAIPPFTDPQEGLPSLEDLRRFFTKTYPASGPDFAKLAFWSFVAGFSERFVPQIIQRVSDDAGQGVGGASAKPPSGDEASPEDSGAPEQGQEGGEKS